MVVNSFSRFYGVIIIIGILIGFIYIYSNLLKENIDKKNIFYFFLIYIFFAIICAKIYTSFIYNISFLKAGFSSYGGLIGVVIGAILFEQICPSNNNIIKYTILSLPLVYSITKIACLLSGCCGGVPYNGFFYIRYRDLLNIKQFPIQLVEVIVFMNIFIICNKYKNNMNIIYYCFIISIIFKFILDYFRYDHISTFITINQIFSILLLFIVVIIFIKDNYRKRVDL